MSLTEVLPEVQTLSRLDKIRLIQLLAQELQREEDGLIEPGRSYAVWSPDRAFTAAAALLQALEDDAGQWTVEEMNLLADEAEAMISRRESHGGSLSR